MNEFVRFGSPALIEIAARWTKDHEPRERLPQESGWSTGDLQITVGHQVLTARRFGDSETKHISWYLSPLMDWLIRHWTWLFHEEAYAWPEKSGAPAAAAVLAALGRSIALSDPAGRDEYKSVQGWWMRHALRAADPSALYPDLCFRRAGDDIEISWSGRQPVHAPDGFMLMLPPGYASFAVRAVVEPLWQFLKWGISTAPASAQSDQEVVSDMKKRFQRLQRTPLKELELRYLNNQLRHLLDVARASVPLEDQSTRVKDIPAISSLDPAVLMFGGLNPSIGERDAVRLMQFMARHQSAAESGVLLDLIDNRPPNLSLAPYQEGYDLAEDAREDLDIADDESCVNIQLILRNLGVSVEEVALDTDSVRGVAIAGSRFSPAILVNTTSAFNKSREGRRFTMAHELCHIIFDRTRAKKLSHVSGAWTNARIEKRANAFAAMFLASRTAIRQSFKGASVNAIKMQAKELEIGFSALVEHLYNLNLIDEAVREQLRESDRA